jgi:hypothetical protein
MYNVLFLHPLVLYIYFNYTSTVTHIISFNHNMNFSFQLHDSIIADHHQTFF